MFSKIVRRTHMYLALFFTPWITMYAVSTIAMNHRPFFESYYGGELVEWEAEQDQTYPGTFPDEADPKFLAQRVLAHLDLEGSFNARRSPDGQSYTIVRQDPVTPRRITYSPADSSLIIEKQAFRTPVFLERLHRLRGYRSEFLMSDVWAVSVDLVIIAMTFWVLSGLWMWWELKSTRVLGAILFSAGTAIFVFFVVTI